MLQALKGKECIAFKWNRRLYNHSTAAFIVKIKDVKGKSLKIDVLGYVKMPDDDVCTESNDRSNIGIDHCGLHETTDLDVTFEELGPLTLFEDFKDKIAPSRIVIW